MSTARSPHLLLALIATVAAGVLSLGSAAPAQACGVTPRDAAVRYYRGIDKHHFKAAWRCLSTATRREFGGYRKWRRGYRDMVWTRLRSAETTDQAAGFAHVRVRIRSCTETDARARVERFGGTWEAIDGYAGWRLHNPSIRRTSRRTRPRC